MADYGIKVSLPGYSVLTATPEQCAIHSGYPSPKVKVGASPAHFNTNDYTFGSDPGAGTTNLVTVAHGYSYIPFALCFAKDFQTAPDTYVSLPINIAAITGAAGVQEIIYYTDGTNFKVDYVVDATNIADLNHFNINGARYIFKYYIFAESGA